MGFVNQFQSPIRTGLNGAFEWQRTTEKASTGILDLRKRYAYQIIPELYSADGSTTFPFTSSAFSMLKVDKIDAVAMNRVATARCMPGQILDRFRSRSVGGGGQ
jgi:hypothetical protein